MLLSSFPVLMSHAIHSPIHSAPPSSEWKLGKHVFTANLINTVLWDMLEKCLFQIYHIIIVKMLTRHSWWNMREKFHKEDTLNRYIVCLYIFPSLFCVEIERRHSQQVLHMHVFLDCSWMICFEKMHLLCYTIGCPVIKITMEML